MADQKPDEKAAAPAPAPPAAPKAEPTPPPPADPAPDLIPVERLIAEAQDFLGVESYVVAGALHGQDATELTVAATQALVRTWLAKPAVTEESVS